MTCPICSCPGAYVGLVVLECINMECPRYVAPRAEDKKFEIEVLAPEEPARRYGRGLISDLFTK